jgi:hypothetical protein
MRFEEAIWHGRLALVYRLDKRLIWNRVGGARKHHVGTLVWLIFQMSGIFTTSTISPFHNLNFFIFISCVVIEQTVSWKEENISYTSALWFDISEHSLKES